MPPGELYQFPQTAFIQAVRAAVAGLEAYNEDELFYRKLHELRDDRKALRAYMAGFDIQDLRKRKLILPEDMERAEREKQDIILPATSFFSPIQRRNVILYKHNRYSPAFRHCHDYFEIFFVLSGQCANTIGTGRAVLTEGHLCFIAPGVQHIIEVFDDSIVVNIMIKRSTFDEVFLEMLTTSDILSGFFMRNIYYKNNPEYIIFNIARDTDLLEQFLAMVIEQNHNDGQSSRIMDSRLSIFFSLIIRKYGNSPLVYDQIGLKEKYWNIIAYINGHFRTITLSQLALRFNLSTAFCSRIIKSITGKNFTALVRDLRMNQARAMLISTKTKIHEISFSLGYENQETFIRNFKKHFGMTPQQFRTSPGCIPGHVP
ncbi:AraC family transcriptional regulator [Spirochaetia bacterium]|nr:AraC family transcriptional regulator [Spirochaetia bacterium]